MKDFLKGATRGGFIFTATLLLYLVISLIGRLIVDALKLSGTAYYTVCSLFSVSVLTVATFLFNDKTEKIHYFRKCSYKHIFFALLLAFGMLLGFGFINTLVADGITDLGGQIQTINLPLDTVFQYLLFTVFICVLPACLEETFFRGVLLSSVKNTCKTYGVITVALCFALYHGNVAQLGYQFIFGLGLGVLTIKCGSVMPAVIAHFINNFIVLSIEFFKISVDFFNPFIIAAGIVLLIVFAVLIFLSGEKSCTEQTTPRKNILWFYFPFGWLGIASSVLLIVLSALPVG